MSREAVQNKRGQTGLERGEKKVEGGKESDWRMTGWSLNDMHGYEIKEERAAVKMAHGMCKKWPYVVV